MVHYIPTKSNATSINVANLFVTYVWKLHGLPKSTVSDCGSVFNSKFLKQLYKRLDIKLSYSTAYHPETDGQSERANQVVEIFIQAFTNHCQSDWVSLLPMAEFAYNNGVNASTGKTPFQICQGFNPHFAVGEDTDYRVPNADDHAKFLNQGYNKVKAALALAQEQYKYFYDQNHCAPEELKEGDKVWLSHQNISTDRPSIKLSHKKLGPYKVQKKIGSHAYQLELPHTMRIHPVFHTALLKKSKPDPHGRDPPQPPPIVTKKGEEEYKVEEIVNSRKRPRKLFEYYVKWKRYDQGSNTWEPLGHLEHAKDAIAKYHKKNPCAPRP